MGTHGGGIRDFPQMGAYFRGKRIGFFTKQNLVKVHNNTLRVYCNSCRKGDIYIM